MSRNRDVRLRAGTAAALARFRFVMIIKAVLVFLAALAFSMAPLVVPGFGGFDPSKFPNPQVDPPVQPMGYTFAIWGLIYAWLVAHAAIGLLVYATSKEWDRTRLPLFGSLLVGITWLSVAQSKPLLAEIEIFLMLGLALLAVARSPHQTPWLLGVPLAIYAGWLSAASFAGLGINAAGYGIWFGQLAWAYIAILIAVALAVVVIVTLRPHPAYGLAVAWALVGIAAQNWGEHWGLVALTISSAGLIGVYGFKTLRLWHT